MKQIKSATRYMVILGRTFADGTEEDYKTVNALQAQYKIVPLSAYGKSYAYKAPPVNPNPAVQAALKDLGKTSLQRIEANKNSLGKMVNGWVITKDLGIYGTDYMKRAVVAAYGWPANRQEDAVYPYTEVDGTGQKLSGAHKYTLTFAKGETPPVDGFWSITMYAIDKGWWFVPNALNKLTVSARNDLKSNADGSVTLYFQNESPGKDKEASWLPHQRATLSRCCGCTGRRSRTPRSLTGRGSPQQSLSAIEGHRPPKGWRANSVKPRHESLQ